MPYRHSFCNFARNPGWLRLVGGVATAALLTACGAPSITAQGDPNLVAQGMQIFRFDTFGDEAQWTDALKLHQVIATAVDPTTALSVGLKVDAQALPQAVVDGIKNGSVDLVSAKLPALQAYQLSLRAPQPPAGSFDATAAQRGKVLFEGAARCST